MPDTSPHDERHERMLQEVVTGDRDREDALVRRRIADCEVCAAAVRELLELADLLHRDALGERAALRRSPDGGAAPGADRIGPGLAALVEEERHRRSTRPGPAHRAPWPRRLAWMLPLAAAVLLLVVTRGARDEPLPEPGLGLPLGVELRALAPRGEVAAFDDFRWEADLASGGWYTLRIWAGRREPGQRALLEVTDLTDAAWIPSANELERLPGRIEWQVRRYDEHGAADGSDGAEAWLPGF